MPNDQDTWATGFIITTDAGNSYSFGKTTEALVGNEQLPTYAVRGNIAGMKFDNLERMQYFAFMFDLEQESNSNE